MSIKCKGRPIYTWQMVLEYHQVAVEILPGSVCVMRIASCNDDYPICDCQNRCSSWIQYFYAVMRGQISKFGRPVEIGGLYSGVIIR